MSLRFEFNRLPIAWKVYFGSLIAAFIMFVCFIVYLFLSDNGAVDGGLVIVAGLMYLLYFAIFVAVNIVVYMLGSRYVYARRILVYSLGLIALAIFGFTLFNLYVMSEYDKKYRPLTQREAIELIESCNVTSIEVGVPTYYEIRLNLVNGKDRTTNRFASDTIEDELRFALVANDCKYKK